MGRMVYGRQSLNNVYIYKFTASWSGFQETNLITLGFLRGKGRFKILKEE